MVGGPHPWQQLFLPHLFTREVLEPCSCPHACWHSFWCCPAPPSPRPMLGATAVSAPAREAGLRILLATPRRPRHPLCSTLSSSPEGRRRPVGPGAAGLHQPRDARVDPPVHWAHHVRRRGSRPPGARGSRGQRCSTPTARRTWPTPTTVGTRSPALT